MNKIFQLWIKVWNLHYLHPCLQAEQIFSECNSSTIFYFSIDVLYNFTLLHHISQANIVLLPHYICLTALVTFQVIFLPFLFDENQNKWLKMLLFASVSTAVPTEFFLFFCSPLRCRHVQRGPQDRSNTKSLRETRLTETCQIQEASGETLLVIAVPPSDWAYWFLLQVFKTYASVSPQSAGLLWKLFLDMQKRKKKQEEAALRAN